MSDCDDDDVHICDTCQDIFLTKAELVEHEAQEHSSKQTKEEERKSNGKRSRSNSSDREHVKKKKVKMGPASQVKRDRSSSPEVKKRSKSPEPKPVSRTVDRLASVESSKSDKSDRSDRHHKKHKHKDRDRDEERHHKKHNHKDRDRDEERPHKKHKERDRSRSRERAKQKMKDIDVFSKGDSSDDEEKNRRKAEKAKESWKKKDDFSKGKDSFKSRSSEMDDFIDDDDKPKKKIRDEPKFDKKHFERIKEETKKSSSMSLGFATQGTVKAHDNEGGPECFKCGQVCKDNSNLKNHVLSHYYQVFYEVLPDSKPYPCPLCESTSRDRITLVRHYAFTHKKLFEMTDISPEDIAGSRVGSKGSQASKAPKKNEVVHIGGKADKESPEKRKESSKHLDVEDKIKSMNSKYFKINDGSSRNGESEEKQKKNKKHKHKHKDHKHKKEKKHKKDKHREKEEDPSNPLSSLIKEMSPVSSNSDNSNQGVRKNGDQEKTVRTPPDSPPRSPERYQSPVRDIHESNEQENENVNANNADEESDDDLGDIAPVFA